MSNYNVLEIANYIMNTKKILSNKKLQKLVYYSYVWYLVKNNNSVNNLSNKLFDSKIEAWVHGPVCPELYTAYNMNKIRDYTSTKIDSDTKLVLDAILKVYGNFSGDELEYFSHQETPWQKAREGYSKYQRCNEPIKDEDIYLFYSNKIK